MLLTAKPSTIFKMLKNTKTNSKSNDDDYPSSSFDKIVYYEIFTKHGDRFDRRTKCNGTFSSTADAYNEMQNHANDKRPNGTGWMDQITNPRSQGGPRFQ